MEKKKKKNPYKKGNPEGSRSSSNWMYMHLVNWVFMERTLIRKEISKDSNPPSICCTRIVTNSNSKITEMAIHLEVMEVGESCAGGS